MDIAAEMENLVTHGLAVQAEDKDGDPAWSLTDAGKDFMESVMMAGIEERHAIYALGRLQGLREAE